MLAMTPCTTNALETTDKVYLGTNILTEIADIPSEVFLLKQLQAKNAKQIRKAACINMATKAAVIATKLLGIALGYKNMHDCKETIKTPEDFIPNDISNIVRIIPQVLDIIVDGIIIGKAKTIAQNNTNKNNSISKALLALLTTNKILFAATKAYTCSMYKDGSHLGIETGLYFNVVHNGFSTYSNKQTHLRNENKYSHKAFDKWFYVNEYVHPGAIAVELATWLAYFIAKTVHVAKLCKKQS